MKKILKSLTVFGFLAMVNGVMAAEGLVDPGFKLPSFSDIIGFTIKFLFFFGVGTDNSDNLLQFFIRLEIIVDISYVGENLQE